MGRFDELTQLEKKPIQPTPFQERRVENTSKPASPQTVLPANPHIEQSESEVSVSSKSPQAGKTASSQTRKQSNPQMGLSKNEQVEKYTTRLEPSLVKKIKLYALENDMNDYDVIRTAVKKLLAEEK